MLTAINRKKTMEMPLRTFFVSLLLLLYVAGTVQIDAFHDLFHADAHTALHTPEQENDPCHRNIYHHDRDNGCEHKAHIKGYEKCALCDMVLHTEHLLPTRLLAMAPRALAISPCGLHAEKADGFFIYGSSRAPPVL